VTLVWKIAPLLLCWGVLLLMIARGSVHGKRSAAAASVAFIAGVAVQKLLLGQLPGQTPFLLIRWGCGAAFLAFLALSVARLCRPGDRQTPERWVKARGMRLSRFAIRDWLMAPGAAAVFAGILSGAIMLSILAPLDGRAVPLWQAALLAVAGCAIVAAALGIARWVPEKFAPEGSTLAALIVSGLLFMACSFPRLDLFSPLCMTVMKFIHDFVHQFFESMLIPDHPFFRSEVWDYIALLFGDRVGLWGGLVIWYLPLFLLALAIRLERLPPVAHIRQGARRRKVLAGFLRERRWRLAPLLLALLFLTAAAYRSRNPSVEYWDPAPLAVSSTPSGEILIPLKGEVDLQGGMLHKFLYRQGGKEVRFFLLRAPDGRIVASLDACAICKPEGYGQSGAMVLCYYCKTLIPVETVGRVGGCNPVPIESRMKGDAVSIDALTLVSKWSDTVQQTDRHNAEAP
jgi:hypothetical protein